MKTLLVICLAILLAPFVGVYLALLVESIRCFARIGAWWLAAWLAWLAGLFGFIALIALRAA